MSERPIPVVDADSSDFWEAAARHELNIPYCTNCSTHFFYPRALCPHCHSDAVESRRASGEGVIYSYTVSRRPAAPAFKELTPYVVALVKLAEGPRMLTNIVTDDVENICIGQRVQVTFKDIGDGLTLPLFRVVGD